MLRQPAARWALGPEVGSPCAGQHLCLTEQLQNAALLLNLLNTATPASPSLCTRWRTCGQGQTDSQAGTQRDRLNARIQAGPSQGQYKPTKRPAGAIAYAEVDTLKPAKCNPLLPLFTPDCAGLH